MVLAVIAWLGARIVAINGGRFGYTLDDAYIHLSMSEQIAAGGYGVNANEYAAAASSILYPLLLAPGAGFFWHEYLPMAIGIACVSFSLNVIRIYLGTLGFGESPAARWAVAMLSVGFVLAFNVVGVAFSGMEHSLHILLAMLTVLGLIRHLEDGKPPAWLVPVLILGPLVRYEALALNLAVIAVLASNRAWRPALLGLGGIALSGAGFSVFLIAIGQAPLPSSVLAKSYSAAAGMGGTWLGVIAGVIANVIRAATEWGGLATICAGLFGAVTAWRLRGDSSAQEARRRTAALVLAAATGAHVVAGGFNWFHRYEIYIVTAAAMLIVYLVREPVLVFWRQSGGIVRTTAAGLTAMAIVGYPYLIATVRDIPLAASNIYQQQYQMHRFVTDFHRGPVAVNDLGWVSYRNPGYVLDLWGLGSEEARRQRAADPTSAWMARMVSARGVRLAMVYADWFSGGVPDNWVLVATLRLGHERVSSARAAVEFYATVPAAADELRGELHAFASTLPDGIALDFQ